MYETFFGLTAKPFDLVPNPQFLYRSRSHQRAMDYLQYGIGERAGFILLTGEVGSGKTTILRNLIRTIDSGTPVSMVFNTRVASKQLLSMINEDFGLRYEGRDKAALLRDLNDFLLAQHTVGFHPIIIIDEAQNLSSNSLEDIRLLSNLETDSHKLVQIILVGQPELKNLIGAPALSQLRQRISVNCHLGPLTRDETQEYIYHRLAVAGNRQAVTFEPGVFDLIFRFSSGIPRMINQFCEFLLLAAFSEESRRIKAELATEVSRDLAWEQPKLSPEQPTENKAEKRNALAMELFRLLTFIQNQVVGLNTLAEDVGSIKKALESQNDLIQSLLQNQQRLLRLEEAIERNEQLLAEMVKNKELQGKVIGLRLPGRD